MRFRRRAKLFPGVYLNFSKSGISTTIGVPGASINLGRQGAFLNTGIPGTGLYDRKRIGGKSRKSPSFESPFVETLPPQEDIGSIKSKAAHNTTSEGLKEFKELLLDCHKEKRELLQDIAKAKSQLLFSTSLMVTAYIFIIGFFIPWFKNWREEKKQSLLDLESQLKNCFVDVDMDLDQKLDLSYSEVQEAYANLITSNKIWDYTSAISNDRVATRSAAGTTVTRKPVSFGYKNFGIIKSAYRALHFQNINGGDLYFYPAFIVMVENTNKFGLIDYRDLHFSFHGQRFVETEKVPVDALTVDHTWAKVNKNGSRDKRFKGNYQIPICKYGEMEFRTTSGLHEIYAISSYEKSAAFSKAFTKFLGAI